MSWEEPEDLVEPAITYYYVGVREAGENGWVYVRRTGASASLKGLNNGMEYEVEVVASNIHGRAIAGPLRATPDPAPAWRAAAGARGAEHALQHRVEAGVLGDAEAGLAGAGEVVA